MIILSQYPCHVKFKKETRQFHYIFPKLVHVEIMLELFLNKLSKNIKCPCTNFKTCKIIIGFFYHSIL